MCLYINVVVRKYMCCTPIHVLYRDVFVGMKFIVFAPVAFVSSSVTNVSEMDEIRRRMFGESIAEPSLRFGETSFELIAEGDTGLLDFGTADDYELNDADFLDHEPQPSLIADSNIPVSQYFTQYEGRLKNAQFDDTTAPADDEAVFGDILAEIDAYGARGWYDKYVEWRVDEEMNRLRLAEIQALDGIGTGFEYFDKPVAEYEPVSIKRARSDEQPKVVTRKSPPKRVRGPYKKSTRAVSDEEISPNGVDAMAHIGFGKAPQGAIL